MRGEESGSFCIVMEYFFFGKVITPPCITHYVNNPPKKEKWWPDNKGRTVKIRTSQDARGLHLVRVKMTLIFEVKQCGMSKPLAKTLFQHLPSRPPLVYNWPQCIMVVFVTVDKQGTQFNLLFLFITLTYMCLNKSEVGNNHEQLLWNTKLWKLWQKIKLFNLL